MIFVLATILGFHIWSADINQAYLQSERIIERKVYIRPKEPDLNPGERLQVMLPYPLYVLPEAGDYLGECSMNSHIYDLRMEQTIGDLELFIHRSIDRLLLILATHVEDTLQETIKEYKKQIQDQPRSKFDAKPSRVS